MTYPEFKFVDLAIGGAQKRNNVFNLSKAIKIPANKTDCFTTMFRFKLEYKEHLEKTGSVRGSDIFECWSDYLWFDIDSDDLSTSHKSALSLVRGLEALDLKIHRDVLVFFSGSKGFHIGANSHAFGFSPSVDLPNKMRMMAKKIANLFDVIIDDKIYNHNRLWRIADSVHGKTKLFKTELSYDDFNSSIENIIQKSNQSDSRIPKYVNSEKREPVQALLILQAEQKKEIKEDKWDEPILSNRLSELISTALDYLFETGVEKGNRDNEALLRASECRKLGIDKDECADRIFKWNELNSPPMSESDLSRVIESAYTGKGYDFGTNNSSLKEARNYANKILKSSTDNDTEEETIEYIRKPLSFREILENPNAGAMPEQVGQWISWRGRITLLVGFPKLGGKSTLCTFEVMTALRKNLRALWISNDEPQDDIVRRFKDSGLSNDCESLFIAGDVNSPRSWDEIKNFINEVKPDLIILDSIHSIFPAVNKGVVPESSESAEWQKLTAKLRSTALNLNAAIIWIHHANKMGTSAGSIGISAAVDVIVDIKRMGTKMESCRLLEYLGRFVTSSMNKQIRYLGEKKGYELMEFLENGNKKEEDKTDEDKQIEHLLNLFTEDNIDFISDDEFQEKIAGIFGTLVGENKKKVENIIKRTPIDFVNNKWRLRKNETV